MGQERELSFVGCHITVPTVAQTSQGPKLDIMCNDIINICLQPSLLLVLLQGYLHSEHLAEMLLCRKRLAVIHTYTDGGGSASGAVWGTPEPQPPIFMTSYKLIALEPDKTHK